MAGRITLSTTDEDEAVYEELEEDIEKLFGGKSGFWRSHLRTYDDESRIRAKIKLKEQKIEEHKKQIEDLKWDKKSLEQQLEERGFTDDSEEKEYDEGTENYWNKTCETIFVRNSREEAASVERRYERWFDGRFDVFVNKFGEIPVKDYRQLLFEKARERGHEDKVDELQEAIE